MWSFFYPLNPYHDQTLQVTRLERDASSGTALQEISFWLNLENALNRIQRKRDSPEVNLTLDVLKAGKRFHATVSFDSDTGTQEPLQMYSPLLPFFFLVYNTTFLISNNIFIEGCMCQLRLSIRIQSIYIAITCP